MTPNQRERLDAVEKRGYIGCDGQRMVNTMREIDERQARASRAAAEHRHGVLHQQAKAVWWGELISACVLILLLLSVAFFL